MKNTTENSSFTVQWKPMGLGVHCCVLVFLWDLFVDNNKHLEYCLPYLNKTLPVKHVSSITATSTSSTSYLSISGGFDIRVAFLADDVVYVLQAIGGDGGKGLGTV